MSVGVGQHAAGTRIRIGCAGWSLSAEDRSSFGGGDSLLQRYATRFSLVEINSSFYRPHLPQSYRRWAASVPHDFRFTVKMPRSISHEQRLRGAGPLLDPFLATVEELGSRLGALLLQLPPSLAYEPQHVEPFLHDLRRRTRRPVACEPRHPSWFSAEVDALLAVHDIARVAADPARVAQAGEPGGARGWSYWRWHGQPDIYRSAYDETTLARLAGLLRDRARAGHCAWMILDNTAQGHAVSNALRLQALLGEHGHA
ncbi:DUF72 domain-containing protein [Stenotrophomonas sp. TWI169]|uniref:DUF72 domain-containing protein n=1 Tax=Stenotrophomonas sp. TWI169 TaxID=3136773 RepID=UPI00320B070E